MSDNTNNEAYEQHKKTANSMASTYKALQKRRQGMTKQELAASKLFENRAKAMDKYINKDGGSQLQKLKGIMDDTGTNPMRAIDNALYKHMEYMKKGGVFGEPGKQFIRDAYAGAKEKYNEFVDTLKDGGQLIKDKFNDAPIVKGVNNFGDKLSDLSQNDELDNFVKEKLQGIKDNVKNAPQNIKDAVKNAPEAIKEGIKNGAVEAKEGLGKLKNSAGSKMKEIKDRGIKGNLKNMGAKNLDLMKKGASLAGDLDLPGANAMGAAVDAAKTVKSAAKAATAIAKGAVNPAGAVAMVAKDFLQDMAKDPSKAVRKFLTCCACICACVCTAVSIIVIPIFILLNMFFTFLSNDSTKDNGPRAADSWIYKYSEADYKDIMKDKISTNPDNIYVVSHNADLQRDKKEEDILAEDSDEMLKSEGYTDEALYMYREPSLSAEKILAPFRYGRTVVGHVADGEKDVSEVDGFIPIELEETDTGRKPEDLEHMEGDGLDNQDLNKVNKNVYYVEKRFVYKKKQADPNMEYTLRDEYKVMSMALRKALTRKQTKSLELGNKKIDDKAKQYKPEISEADIVNGDKYKLVNSSIVRDENGNIVGDLSEVEDPERDTYNAAESRAALSASANSQAAFGQDVATILSGYAAAKADSLPQEGYYQMLDTTMEQYLENSLTLQDDGMDEKEMSRPLSEKKTATYKVMHIGETQKGIMIKYQRDMSRYNPQKYKRIPGRDFFIDPDSENQSYDIPKYGNNIRLKKDLKKGQGYIYTPHEADYWALLSVEDYADYVDRDVRNVEYLERDFKNIGELKEITVVSDIKKDVSYKYKEFRSKLSITPLDANEVVWEFFKKDTDGFYPMVKKKIDNVKDVDGKEVDIPSIPDDNWQDKMAVIRKLPYYQQQLAYIFKNPDLESEGYTLMDNPLADYPKENKQIWCKIVSGTPEKEIEKISESEFKEHMGDEDVGDTSAVDGYMLNWRREIVEDYSISKTENIVGTKAERNKFFFIIPTDYYQEYRRASDPEQISKERLDENGEYIKKFKRTRSFTGEVGGFIPAGEIVEPVKGWRNKITSRFGMRTLEGKRRLHAGLDIGTPTGTPVYAVRTGTVKSAGFHESMGNYVWLKHDGGLETIYMHNSRLLVRKGDSVEAGQQVAESGNTGHSTGPHCHFQVELNGKPFDPEPWLKSESTTSTGGVNNSVSVDDEEDTSSDTTTTTEEENTDENKGEDVNRQVNRETVTESVGNKMDYWYDNIMQLFDEEDNVVNTNGGQSVVDLALSYVGNVGGVYFKNAYMGTPGNEETQELTPGNTFHWCAAFVSVIMKEAGYPGYTGHGGYVYNGTANSISKDEALAPWSYGNETFAEFAREKGQLQPGDGSYIPKPGDLILYKNDGTGSGAYSHMGFVVSSDSKGVTTVEGNTTGPGAGKEDDGTWKGCVNSHSNIRYSNNIEFVNIPYPDTNTLENVLGKYAASMLGGSSTKADAYGRIGLGLWHGDNARKLLNDIAAVHQSEVEAIIAESEMGKDFQDFLDGKTEMTQALSTLAVKVLRLPQSQKIQERMLSNRIKEIDEWGGKILKEDWDKVDSRSKALFIISQLAADAHGEPNWLASKNISEKIREGVAKSANIDTFISDLKTWTNNTAEIKLINMYEYQDWEAIAAVNNVTDWKVFYGELSAMLKNIQTSVKSIPEKDLAFGLGNGKRWIIPPGYGSTKSYMGNHLLTGKSKQRDLKAFTVTGPHGIGMIDGRMTVAMYADVPGKAKPRGFGCVGDMVDIQLSTGQVLHCVIGDAKNIKGDRKPGDKTNEAYGVHSDGSIVEFILNTQVEGRYPDKVPSFTRLFPGEVRIIVNNGPCGR